MVGGNGHLTRIEQLNMLVRSLVTLALTAGVLYGFIIARVIPPDVFVPLASGVIIWWFARDQASASTKEAAEMIKTPPPQSAAPPPEGKP